jgi:hypothetical protein
VFVVVEVRLLGRSDKKTKTNMTYYLHRKNLFYDSSDVTLQNPDTPSTTR